jgi:pSer/pThr/pTyr-binding forkhead associated (FHA) protein
MSMVDKAVLRQELADLQKCIARLSDEIRAIQGFIAADERNVNHAVDTIRINARQSLENYRLSLTLKQGELSDMQQQQRTKQVLLQKSDEVERKEQEVARLGRDRDRINSMYDRAVTDLDLLKGELDVMMGPAPAPREFELVMAGGQRITLPTSDADLLIGCKDAADGIFPDIDLTPFGGTASGVSRRHATLTLRNGQWTLRDENSTNGTFVDETRLAPHVPRPLTGPAALRFGGVSANLATRTQSPPAGKTRRLS